MEAVKAFLERRLKLKVNASKSAVARPWQRKCDQLRARHRLSKFLLRAG
jgi:hypothetical protein